MERYYSWGGSPNPEFYYKVRLTNLTDDMINWCEKYQSHKGYYCNPGRYYINIKGENREVEWIEFQFETEEPAIMFALTFGAQ